VSWAGCANFGTGRDITKARAKAFILGSHFYSHNGPCFTEPLLLLSRLFEPGSLLLRIGSLEIGHPDSLPPASTSHARV